MLESFVSRREVRELLRSGPAGSYFEDILNLVEIGE